MMAHGDNDLAIGDKVTARFAQFAGRLVPYFERRNHEVKCHCEHGSREAPMADAKQSSVTRNMAGLLRRLRSSQRLGFHRQ